MLSSAMTGVILSVLFQGQRILLQSISNDILMEQYEYWRSVSVLLTLQFAHHLLLKIFKEEDKGASLPMSLISSSSVSPPVLDLTEGTGASLSMLLSIFEQTKINIL